MIIAVDFDGTCVTHEFPKVGRDIGAVPVLKDLVEQGHQLILWTMRSDVVDPKVRLEDSDHLKTGVKNGKYLTEAVNWFQENGIPLYGIQRNPTQDSWTSSPKAYAQIYIDDAALGCPLVYAEHERPYVDWQAVREILIGEDILKL